MFDSYVNHFTLRSQRPAVETVMDISPRFKPPNGMALSNGGFAINKNSPFLLFCFFHTHLMATTQITGNEARGGRVGNLSVTDNIRQG